MYVTYDKKNNLCLSMMERPVLLSEQFGQVFYVLLEVEHKSHYVIPFFKLNKDMSR